MDIDSPFFAIITLIPHPILKDAKYCVTTFLATLQFDIHRIKRIMQGPMWSRSLLSFMLISYSTERTYILSTFPFIWSIFCNWVKAAFGIYDQSCIKFKKFNSSSVHGIELSSQLKTENKNWTWTAAQLTIELFWTEFKVNSERVECPLVGKRRN